MAKRNTRNTTNAARIATHSALALLPALTFFTPHMARADGVGINDNTGALTNLGLDDDPTIGTRFPYGSSTVRLNAPINDQSVTIVASSSDVHAYIFDKRRVHADNAADATSDMGGDGVNFSGGIEAFRCPMGNRCGWTLTGWANQGKSFIAQREFYPANVNAGAFYIPLESTGNMMDNGASCPGSPMPNPHPREGIVDEVLKAIHTAIMTNSSIQSVTYEHADVVWETGTAMCTRFGRTTGNVCGASSFTRDTTDLIRIHWDAKITPTVPSWCTTTATILDVAFLGLDFGSLNEACNQLSGSYRATADIWLKPFEGNSNNTYMFQASEVYSSFSARAYSGIGAQTLVNQLSSAFESSNAALTLMRGFAMKVGQGLCCNFDHNDPSWPSSCTKDGVNEDDLFAGTQFLKAVPPVRIQLALNLGTDSTPKVDYFGPEGLSPLDNAGLLELELHR